MIEGMPSETALQVAAARAAHLRYDPPPHLLEDEPAAALLGSEGADMIEAHGSDRAWVMTENRIFIPLRARYVEDRLRAAYQAGVRQYVVLGAGLDSFAFRQPAELEGLEIYEVDHPSTQDWKRARIEALGWPIPKNVHFIPCDFEETQVSSVLEATRFTPQAGSLVSWMGVVMYLTKETVVNALTDLNGILAPGSEVVLDYLRPWEDLSARYLELRERISEYLKGAREPHVNRYRGAELLEVFKTCGYSQGLAERREDIYERYIKPLKTRIPLSERFGLAVATR